jgi:hypothetical protein
VGFKPGFVTFLTGYRNAGKSKFQQKQELAAPARYYGDGGTIHQTGEVNVELHEGKAVSVWFRCQMLPFTQREVGEQRAREMYFAYNDGAGSRLTGVEIVDV